MPFSQLKTRRPGKARTIFKDHEVIYKILKGGKTQEDFKTKSRVRLIRFFCFTLIAEQLQKNRTGSNAQAKLCKIWIGKSKIFSEALTS